ncbi:MAG: hypothetical protein J6S67_23395, partial [Methanobrevibacter sp.]|nr:hypothetical protein [Methanobrevibacter sp.]
MDEKNTNLQAEDTLAVLDPEAYVLSNPTPRDWNMNVQDIARSLKVTPYESVTTKAQREGDQLNVPETIGTGIWESIKRLPKSISETIDIANIEAYSSPNMTEPEAARLLQDALYTRHFGRKAEDQLTAEKIKYKTLYNISGAVGDLIKYVGVGILGGLPAVTGTAAAESYAEAEAGMVDSYIDKTGTIEGYEKKRGEDVALAGAYGVFSGITETALGVERIAAGALNRYGRMEAAARLARQKGQLYKSAALRAGRRFGMSGLEEGAEEFVQQLGEDVAKYWAGYEDAVFTDENFKKAITAAAYGALIGGPAGWGLYRINRQSVINKINDWNNNRNLGMTEQQVIESADQILDESKTTLLDEIATRAEIKNGYGQAFDTVKARITELIDATGTTPWTDQNKTKEQYVEDVAKAVTLPAIIQANKAQLPLSDFLEVADLNVTDTSSGKAPILNFVPIATIDDLQRMLDEQNAIIKEENDAAKIGNANPERKQSAQRRKAILQYHIRAKQLENGLQNVRRTRKKEQADYVTAKDLQPEQTATLDTAVQAEEGQDYVLFAGKRIPVEYQVVELSTIQPSHINGTPNPLYTNTALQNRASRGTTQDVADLREKATNITPERLLRATTAAEGAPVVNERGEVIAGNGRAEIVRYAYENPESAEKYKTALVNAGFNIEGMEKPILVRKNTTMTDSEQVAAADISNISETSAFDEASQARRDTQYLKDSATPIDFASKLPMSERRGLIQNNGRWNKRRVQQRYEDALLSWLTGNDTQLFENLVLDRGISQKVIDILTSNSAQIYELATKYPELGIREDLYHALQKMQMATRDNFVELTQQVELDGRDVMPENIFIWNWLFTDGTTNRQFMSNYLSTIQKNVEAVNAGQDMFGDKIAPLSKKDALMQALKKTDEARAQTAAERGREYEGLFTQETEEVKNPELAAAIASYNNQFAVQNSVSPEVLQQLDLANENARLDEIYPEYSGETIEIDGKERTVYNSNGDRIAKSAEALRNFYKWFGDSKVVDNDGRPLVVYHGTSSVFDTFDSDVGHITDSGFFGSGFYFTPIKSEAEYYGRIVMPVYLKIEKPFIISTGGYYSGLYDNLFEGGGQLLKDLGLLAENDLKDFNKYERLKKEFLKNVKVEKIYTYDAKHTEIQVWRASFEKNGRSYESNSYRPWEEVGYNEKADTKENALNNAWGEYAHFNDLNFLIQDLSFTDYIRTNGLAEELSKIIKSRGYDGTIAGDEHIVFEPNQIKSVDNRGTYDSRTPNIYYQTEVYDGLTTTRIWNVMRILRGLKDSSTERLLYDKQKDTWFLENADNATHVQMFIKAFNQGNYPEFNNEREAEQYFQENYLADDQNLLQFLAQKYDNPADTKQAMEHTLGTDEYTHAYLRNNLVVYSRYETDLSETDFPLETFDHYKVEYDENNNREIKLAEKAKVPYVESLRDKPIDPRDRIPKVRGGWTKEKILRYLKNYGSHTGVGKAVREIANFDSVEDFIDHVFYHGARYGTSGSMKPSITMSDREIERIGGGGYGEKYWAISVTKSKKVAGNFATSMGGGNIYPVLLAKNAKVIEMPNLTDSVDLENYIVDLYEKGIDAVWIGDKNAGEQELAVINPRALINIGNSEYYEAYGLGTEKNPIRLNTEKDFQRIFEFAKDYKNKDESTRFDEAKQTVLWQRRGQTLGFYDPELQAIVLGKNWNETTLVHEFHHRYLEKIWGIYKQAIAGVKTVAPAFMEDTQKLFEMLEIDAKQDQLTAVQQEKFASMVEAYLTGLGVDNADNLAFKAFLHWIPEKYKSVMDIGYLDEQGNIQNPFLDQESIDFFDKWFASPFAPSLPSAPQAQKLVNVTDDKNEIIPSTQKVMNNREKEWGQDSEEQNKADAQLWRAIGENNPSEIRAAMDGEQELMKAEAKQMEDDRILPEKPKLRDKWFKARQPDARTLAAEKARAYLEKNPEHARELAFADPETLADFDAPVDQGMLIRAVMETVPHGSDEWYILDNNLAMVKSMSGSTLSLSGDLSHQAYLDAKREVEAAREMKAAVNYAGTREGAMEKWNNDIRAFTAKRVAAIMATKPNSQERKVAIEAFLEEAKTKFSGNTTNAILNQLDLTGMKTKNSQAFIKWAENQIKQAAHAKIDTKEQAELMKASVKAQLALRDINSTEQKDGKFARAVQSAKDIRHWQFVKDKMKKAYIGRWGKFGIWADNLFGGYMPSAMLMSI